MSVDWRNNWNTNWISSLRHQGGSSNCWAFAMTALYEAMVRIEHMDWCRRSEGEASRGPGKQWWDLGNLAEAAEFVQKFGLADPDCFPWTEHAALLTAKHPGAIPFVPLSPTPDREGRTVKAPAPVTISKVEDKKVWLERVGPMAVMFSPPEDFGSLGTGIYVPTTTTIGDAHALLVVGFDDTQQCWIVKNSYGTSWGNGGFGRIAFSANLLEPLPFFGVRGTNVDPNTKRRSSNGGMVRAGNGANRNNYELFITRDNNIEHWWREHGVAAMPWGRVGTVRSTDPWRGFNDKPLDRPAAVQSTFNRNFEIIYRSDMGGLRHVYFDQAAGMWTDGKTFGPADARGVPGFIQGSRGAPGDFEVVVQNSRGQLEHWTKHSSFPWTRRPGEWYHKETFGGGILMGGSALVQSRLGVTSEIENGTGELHYVCVDYLQRMQHWSKSGPEIGSWIQLGSFFIDRITSAPVMIEGIFGMHDETNVGNFELCVGVNGRVEHWWRDNAAGASAQWRRSAVFGGNVARVLALLQGPFGYNLEMIVQRFDGRVQHYWRDATGWRTGVIIV